MLWKAGEGEEADEEVFMQTRKSLKMIWALLMMIPVTVVLTSNHRATESIRSLKIQKAISLLNLFSSQKV